MEKDYLFLEMRQGGDFQIQCVYKDSQSGVPNNITGATFAAQARKMPEDVLAFSFTFAITNAANGEFTMSCPAATTSALDILETDTFKYDVEMTIGGAITKMFWGDIKMIREITR